MLRFLKFCCITFLLCLTAKCIKSELQNGELFNSNHGSQSLLKATTSEDLSERLTLNGSEAREEQNLSIGEKQHHLGHRSFTENKALNDFKAKEGQQKSFGEKQHHSWPRRFTENERFYALRAKEKQDVSFEEKAREDAYRKTEAAQHPYAVAILMSKGRKHSGSCSGTLLTLEWVLTAAHCLHGVTSVEVFAGLVNLKDRIIHEKIPEKAKNLTSYELYPHPDYEPTSIANDVGLIKLNDRFNLTKYSKPIKLSTEPWTQRGYRNCVVTGFGVVQIKENSPDDLVRKTHELEAKKPCLCDFKLAMLFGREVADSAVCTRPEQDFGTCQGDSGSALVCDNEIKAVVSAGFPFTNLKLCSIMFPFQLLFGIECGGANTLGIFHDTCPVLKWINSHVELFNVSDIAPECMADRSASEAPKYRYQLGFYVILAFSLWLAFF